ncbi:uncharacterized protein LOC112588429 [Harpegnathos saltator]|uniref:uncharacterized protein LOC112588429 n=1 Tax=Harpegnathos saltator TaxID=610380 RepID=UPI000DBED240|nr:uncharacterized protein LOC112588429 [Harpegnathos saltator]
MTTRLLQANLHRARQAQPLFEHTMVERGAGLGIAAEPYYVPRNHPSVKSLGLIEYRSRLQEIGDAVRQHLQGPVIVAGDFNAKAAGESIIDLTWATPAAMGRVQTWRVADEIETLSDHLIIEMELSVTPNGLRPVQRKEPRPGRWSLAKLNREILEISLEGSTWPRRREGQDLDSEVMEVMDILAQACDASMPRVRSCPKRSAWWWSDHIAELRRRSVHARRTFRNERNKRPQDPEAVLATRMEFCKAAVELREAIGVARGRGWDDLLLSLDADPWGRPYRMVMQKMRPWTPPKTVTLDPRFLERVMGTLFPVGEGNPITPYIPPSPEQQGEVPGVTEEEVAGGVKKVKNGKAPGPDGIPGRVLTLASGVRDSGRALLCPQKPPEVVWDDRGSVAITWKASENSPGKVFELWPGVRRGQVGE